MGKMGTMGKMGKMGTWLCMRKHMWVPHIRVQCGPHESILWVRWHAHFSVRLHCAMSEMGLHLGVPT